MAKGDKVKLKFNLDDQEEVASPYGNAEVLPAISEESIEEVKPTINEQARWEALMLPVPVLTAEGNYAYSIAGQSPAWAGGTMKLLDVVTAEEFKSWLRSVLPMPEAQLDEYMGLNEKDKKHSFHNLKVRRKIFDAVLKLHEQRWLFAKGAEKFSNEVRWN